MQIFQTISRNSNRSRKSRAESASHGLNRGQSSDSDSDHEEGKGTTFEPDFNTVDISDEKAFDTDLEVEGIYVILYLLKLKYTCKK
jgi:hypothetical protein